MSISSQRATETQRAAYALLVDLFHAAESSRTRGYKTDVTKAYADRLASKYHGALDMYSVFTGEDAEAVNDEVVESYQGRMEMNS
jgi:hypothetical protein